MYCPVCDENLPRRMKACPNCGGSLDRTFPGDTEYEESLASYAKAKRYFLYWIGSIVLGAIIMTFGPGRPFWILGLATLIGGNIPLIIAACQFAKSKGYSQFVGLLIFFGFFGGIALFVLPNRFRDR